MSYRVVLYLIPPVAIRLVNLTRRRVKAVLGGNWGVWSDPQLPSGTTRKLRARSMNRSLPLTSSADGLVNCVNHHGVIVGNRTHERKVAILYARSYHCGTMIFKSVVCGRIAAFRRIVTFNHTSLGTRVIARAAYTP